PLLSVVLSRLCSPFAVSVLGPPRPLHSFPTRRSSDLDSRHRPDPARPREAGLPLRAALRARQAHALREHAAPQGSAAGPQGGLLPVLRGHAMPEPLLKVRNLKKYFPIRGGLFSREVARVHAVD